LLWRRTFPFQVARIATRAGSDSPAIALVSGQSPSVVRDATLITLAGFEHDLGVWDYASDKAAVAQLSRGHGSVYSSSVSWCGRDHRIATAGGLQEVSVLRWEDGKLTSVAETPSVAGPLETAPVEREPWSAVSAVAWSADCSFIALGTSEGLYFWNPDTGNARLVARFGIDAVNASQTSAEGVLALEWSRDGQLAAGGQDRTVRLFASDGTPGQVLGSHQRPVTAVRWNHRGDQLASTASDGEVLIWGILPYSAQFKVIAAFLANQGGSVSDVAWGPDDSEVATVGVNNTVRVWNATNLVQRVTLSGHAVELSQDGNGRILVGDRHITDDELNELAEQRTIQPLSKEDCARYLHSFGCVP
jgi:WD40 repeat protein